MNQSLDQAKKLLDQRKFKEALVLYIQLVEQLPDEYFGYQGVAECYLGLRDLNQALQYAKRAVELNPNSSTVHVTLAYVFLVQNALEQSSFEASLAFQLEPESPEVLECLGTVLFYQQKFDTATAMLEKAIEKKPSSAIANINLASIYESIGQSTKALQRMSSAFHARPSVKNGYFLFVAYMREHVFFSAIIVLITAALAYYSKNSILLIVTVFLIGVIARRLAIALKRG